MPIYEWKRLKVCVDPECACGKPEGYEYTFTETTRPPKGKGWQRVYSLSIGRVAGAGGSPSRKVNTRGSD